MNQENIFFDCTREKNLYLYLIHKGLSPQFDNGCLILNRDFSSDRVTYLYREGTDMQVRERVPREFTLMPDMFFIYKGCKVYIRRRGWHYDRPPKNESFRELLRNNDFHFILAVIKGKNDVNKIIAYIDNNLSNQRKKAI